MQVYVAIIRRRAVDWYLSVPAIDRGAPLWRPAEAARLAVRLVRLATGEDLPESAVGVRTAGPEDLYLPAGHTPIEACHTDGRWYRGRLAGWVRQSDDTWRAVVCYPVSDVMWERIMSAGHWRTAASSVEAAGSAEPRGTPG
jgi:hypothetical protein